MVAADCFYNMQTLLRNPFHSLMGSDVIFCYAQIQHSELESCLFENCKYKVLKNLTLFLMRF